MAQPYHLPVLAENTEGHRNLLRLLRKAPDGFHGKPCVELDWLADHSRSNCAFRMSEGEKNRILAGDGPARQCRGFERYLAIFGGSIFFKSSAWFAEEERSTPSAMRLRRSRSGGYQ